MMYHVERVTLGFSTTLDIRSSDAN